RAPERVEPLGPVVVRSEAAPAAGVLSGGDSLRREKAYWNRRNAAGFQPLEPDFGREKRIGGPDRDRTGDLMNAIHARSQLRYWPTFGEVTQNCTMDAIAPARHQPRRCVPPAPRTQRSVLSIEARLPT